MKNSKWEIEKGKRAEEWYRRTDTAREQQKATDWKGSNAVLSPWMCFLLWKIEFQHTVYNFTIYIFGWMDIMRQSQTVILATADWWKIESSTSLITEMYQLCLCLCGCECGQCTQYTILGIIFHCLLLALIHKRQKRIALNSWAAIQISVVVSFFRVLEDQWKICYRL